MTERQFSFPRLLVNLSCLLLAAVLLAGLAAAGTPPGARAAYSGSKPETACAARRTIRSSRPTASWPRARPPWYGPGFHGKKTASGERFNQYNISAAHKIPPLGTEVRVTNLEKLTVPSSCASTTAGRSWTTVSSTFRAGAAQRLGVIGKGTARVRIQSLGDAPEVEDGDVVRGNFFVQIGAFSKKDNAQGLIERLTRSGQKGPHDLRQQQPRRTCRWARGETLARPTR